MKEYPISAGAVTYRIKNNRIEFLILRAFKYWDFPKGMVEENETPWEGAIREVSEETGLSLFSFPKDQIYFETSPYGKGKIARYYIIKIEDESSVKFHPNPITGVVEHHEYRWLSYDKARKLMVPRIQEVLDWANQHLHS